MKPPGSGWGRNLLPWELLWTAAVNAKAGRQVGWDELTNRSSEKAITHRKRRLKRMLPAALQALFAPGGERGTYRLTLPPGDICLIELDPEDWLVDAD